MGTRMLLFSSLFLLALPWLGYRYIDEMKNFLLQGQEDAQLLAARAVAVVLNGRAELFHPVDEPGDIGEGLSGVHFDIGSSDTSNWSIIDRIREQSPSKQA